MGIYLNCVPLHSYCIPLCLNLKFRKLYRLAAHDTPTSKKLLKLQLGAISISDIEMVKRMVPLFDSQPFFDGSRLEIFPGQKWSISSLWEHFLVSEHRKPV